MIICLILAMESLYHHLPTGCSIVQWGRPLHPLISTNPPVERRITRVETKDLVTSLAALQGCSEGRIVEVGF